MRERIKEFWCSWFHGGGSIKRDQLDRINWQCGRCGRWADPVSLDDEHRQTAKDMAKAIGANREHPTSNT